MSKALGSAILARLSRQLDIIPTEALGRKITIIGAGAIGSWTALALAKMGLGDICVYDYDDVSIENMNCQFFRNSDIGKPKVEALKSLVKDFTDTDIDVVNAPYDGKQRFRGIVISAVDSMKARKLIWDSHRGNYGTDFVIDPRMGAEQALMYVMRPTDDKDIATYEKTLYTDAAAVAERCTAKSTIYTANLLSGMVAKAVKDIITNNKHVRTMQWSIKDNHQLCWGMQ